MSTTPRTDAQHELRDIDRMATSYFRLLDFARGLERELEAMKADMRQTDYDALGEVARKVAGHIEKPYSAEELAAMIESGDYSAELVMQHLLLLIAYPTAKP